MQDINAKNTVMRKNMKQDARVLVLKGKTAIITSKYYTKPPKLKSKKKRLGSFRYCTKLKHLFLTLNICIKTNTIMLKNYNHYFILT